jgi:prepilin signal peptidase PulO-like enzyme (type II secretory pathway)
MFLPWYGLAGLGEPFGGALARQAGVATTVNAWRAFDLIDILLFLTVIAAVGAAVVAATQQSVALPVAASVIVTALGVLVTVLVLYRLVNEPGSDQFIDLRFGAYLGFVLCAVIALGGFMSMQEEGTSFGQVAERLQGRGAAAPAPVRPGGEPPGEPPREPPGEPPREPPGPPGSPPA